VTYRDLTLGWMAWEADQANGYGSIAAQYRPELIRLGAKIHSPYETGWDALISVCTPTAWAIGNHRHHRPDLVFHTMFEATALPPGWSDNLNCAGLIWTPSQYCHDLFRQEGVTAPIFVSGYGIKHHSFEYLDRRERSQRMKFIIWADTLVSRKNVFLAAKAFVAAGLPDAELEIKVYSFNGMGANVGKLFSDERGNPLANVTLHSGSWPMNKLVSWLHSGDCGIYLSGGEGFGLMPLQMAATGLPVICADNTGMREYLTDSYLRIPCPHNVPSPSLTASFNYKAEIAQPSFEAAVEAIRWAYNHRDELHAMGDQASHESKQWTWEQVTQKAYTFLQQHYD
jgi:glycosyltransferase involved in cell wall biosynthesis